MESPGRSRALRGERDFLLPAPIAARLRLILAAMLGAAVFVGVPQRYGATTRALLGWDLAALVFILLIIVMMGQSTPEMMRRRAAIQDAGRWAILFVIVAGVLFSMLALAFIQKHLKASEQGEAALYLALIAVTILLSWLFAHTIFALHYAHDYYGASPDEADEDGLIGGLEFPSEKQPDYWDFMYFSFVIGMTCQVSDVQISGRGIRRVALAHGIVSFFFNTIILALTINIVASMI